MERKGPPRGRCEALRDVLHRPTARWRAGLAGTLTRSRATGPRRSLRRRAGVLALIWLAWRGSAAAADDHPPTPAPTPAAVVQTALPDALWMREVVSRDGMVVTDSAAASWAGASMLEAGGNAVDAAVAAALAIGVALPGSSGIGGETHLLLRLRDGRTLAIDGSARAPLRSSPEELRRLEVGKQYTGSFYSHKAVATPGTLAALVLALRRYGTRSFAEVVAPAIELAEHGSTWTPAQHAFLEKYTAKMWESEYLRQLFLKDGIEVWGLDHVYCNPDLARFLRRLAQRGPEDFYHGEIAAEIERDMIANGGWLRRGDLGLMEALEREPVRGRYRDLEVVSAPLPAGGAAVVETLGILDRFPADRLREGSVDRLHLLLEACRIALADCFPARRPLRSPDEFAGDRAWLDARARLIRPDRALYWQEISWSARSTIDVGGTTQISTVDAEGNAVSLTQTLGAGFGSGVTVPGYGFPFNSLLNGFEFSDRSAWRYIRSLQSNLNTMAPTILLRDGEPAMVLGSAGSARIAPILATLIVNLVDRRLPPCEAMAAPRALWGGNGDSQSYLEMVDEVTEQQADTLAERGFIAQTRMTYPATPLHLTDFGGVNAILIDPVDGTLVGVGDPRRQGVAIAPRRKPLSAPPADRQQRAARSLSGGG